MSNNGNKNTVGEGHGNFIPRDEESKKPYNEQKARDEFGNEFIDRFKQEQLNFRGDWRQFAFLVANTKPNVEPQECLKEWNKWREQQPEEKSGNYEYIHLEGADLSKWHLENIDLNKAHLEGITLCAAHLDNAKLMGTKLNSSWLMGAFLTKASLRYASLDNATCWMVHLEGADLYATCLEDANLDKAYLDDKTQFLHCRLNSKTYVSSTNLEVAKIDDITKSMLQYSRRRNNWEQSIYRFNVGLHESEGFWRTLQHKFPRIHDRLSKVYAFLPYVLMIRGFWWCSNYGYSTWRVIFSFIIFALLFAILYFIAGGIDCDWNPLEFSCDTGIVENLFRSGNSVQLSWPMVFLRAVYFSVVTMTTLGFGDIYAVVNKPLGHVVLMLQVILGYALLGVLITRFAVLFNRDGPTYVPPESLKHKVEQKSFRTKILLIYIVLPIIIVTIWQLLKLLIKEIDALCGYFFMSFVPFRGYILLRNQRLKMSNIFEYF